MSITGIADQLTEYCECAADVEEKHVQEIVDLISTYTCWAKEPCESFLLGERREVIDLPSCSDCVFEFEPAYYPYDEDSFSFTIVEQSGATVTETATDYSYNCATGKFLIELPSCKCTSSCSTCPATYSLVVEYEAGYETLPDCLLPVFCNLLEVIQAKNTCDCDEDCGCDNEGTVKYASGDAVTAALETELGQILVEQYKRQIGLISLCEDSSMWGLVV